MSEVLCLWRSSLHDGIDLFCLNERGLQLLTYSSGRDPLMVLLPKTLKGVDEWSAMLWGSYPHD